MPNEIGEFVKFESMKRTDVHAAIVSLIETVNALAAEIAELKALPAQ